jgi:LysR family transcriptional regulator of gallate degradation
MDVRQLAYFLKVAQRRSITAAASELRIAQPSLTKSIRMLEKELGVSLFERLPRGVELTEFGRSLLRHAESIQVQFQDALGELESIRAGVVGEVKVGAGPAWLRRHLPLAVARTVTAHPGIRIHITGGFDEALLRGLRRGDLDFVVAEMPSSDRARDLRLVPLTADRLGVCCRPEHPLAGRKRAVPLDALLDFPWIMPPSQTRAQRRLEALFVAQNLTPPIATIETESMAFLLRFLRHSDALTFTVHTTLQAADGAGLVFLNVPALETSREAGLITRRAGWLSPAAAALASELRTICEGEPQN